MTILTSKIAKSYPIKCDQCCAYSINGHAVHEAASCPNDKKPWVIVDGYCVPSEFTYKCDECGEGYNQSNYRDLDGNFCSSKCFRNNYQENFDHDFSDYR